MPSDASEGRDADAALHSTAQRRNARRLGALLAFVIVAIVAAAFAWKISLQR